MTDNDGMLPHLLMADLRRYVGTRATSNDCREELASIFRLLDEAFLSGDADTANAIAVSFVEDLDAEAFLPSIAPYFGPVLTEEYLRTSWHR